MLLWTPLLLVAVSLVCNSEATRAFAEQDETVSVCRKQVCEYELNVTSKLVMGYGQHLAYVREGVAYYVDAATQQEMRVPDSDVKNMLILDSFERIATVVNGQLPGPAIHVEEGATVVVTVRNQLENGGLTMHWHGMYQRGSPWMDGSSMVAQCPIPTGASFQYKFIAEPAGTHGYHAHHGLERPDGVFGALVVHKRRDQRRDQLCANGDFAATLDIWMHEDNTQVYLKRLGPGWFPHGATKPAYNWTRGVDGKLVGEVPFTSALINGRGRYILANGEETQTNVTLWEVQRGGSYCFRFVGATMEKALRVSVDGHALTLIASDGHDVEPITVESVVVHPGETYDVSLVANNDLTEGDGNFWLRATTMEEDVKTHEGRAIIRYEGATDTEPTTSRQTCSDSDECVVFNCPWKLYPPERHTKCLHIDDARSQASAEAPAVFPDAQFEEHFLNFAFGPLGVNRRSFVTPDRPLLTQSVEGGYVPCNDHECDFNACNCTHVLSVPFNTSLQLVLGNLGPHAYSMHPIHLHGHSFHVLAVGQPVTDPATGRLVNMTRDIVCEPGTDCARAQWAQGFTPALNLHNPPLKDTVVVPPGGYAVIRFVTDNPGFWHMHCHMAQHLWGGLGMVLNEAPEMQSHFPAPKGFPRCGSFTYPDNPEGNAAQLARERWAQLAQT